jgi:hypothetical protein
MRYTRVSLSFLSARLARILGSCQKCDRKLDAGLDEIEEIICSETIPLDDIRNEIRKMALAHRRCGPISLHMKDLWKSLESKQTDRLLPNLRASERK